ncbi:MAG: tetratricopeptide repeat protein [Acidobacteriia bacterium]|nr:tetratricopeptide repeat protein [Terriglobia bacterium]
MKKRTTIRDMKVLPEPPAEYRSERMTGPRNGRALGTARRSACAILNWRQALLCALALAVSAVPFYAQRAGGGGGGTHGTGGRGGGGGVYYPPVYTRPNIDPTMQPVPDIPPLPKPTMPDDEKCFPWNLSENRAASVSVTRLKIPSKARGEYEKACDASSKNKLPEAEQHVRKAIEKFENYSAAWVMLGLTLEQQHRVQEAGEACSHALTIDAKYLPAYLCQAEFAVRDQEWKQVLDLADMAQGISSQGNAYIHYYRGVAFFHMNNLDEARKSALAAQQADANYSEPFISMLLAQIYERQGNRANAIAELQQMLKHHTDKDQEEQAKQYLARLESQDSTK